MRPLLAAAALFLLAGPAGAAEIACGPAEVWNSGPRPPGRLGSDTLTVAPWGGGLLIWPRDGDRRMDSSEPVRVRFKNGDTCTVALSPATEYAARLPVAVGTPALIELKLCDTREGGACVVAQLPFVPQ